MISDRRFWFGSHYGEWGGGDTVWIHVVNLIPITGFGSASVPFRFDCSQLDFGLISVFSSFLETWVGAVGVACDMSAV